MKVKNFIISFGIEKLNGKPIIQNGKTYLININQDEINYHSLLNPDWGNSKSRLDGYHSRGNYRFSAMNENEMCVWVYPTTEIEMDNEVMTDYGKIHLINERGIKKIDFSNSKFKSFFHLIGFLHNKQLTEKLTGY